MIILYGHLAYSRILSAKEFKPNIKNVIKSPNSVILDDCSNHAVEFFILSFIWQNQEWYILAFS